MSNTLGYNRGHSLDRLLFASGVTLTLLTIGKLREFP